MDTINTNNITEETCLLCKLVNSSDPIVTSVQGFLGLVSATSNILTAIALVRTENIKRTLKICLTILTIMDSVFGIGFMYHSFALYFIIHNRLECISRYFVVSCLIGLSMVTIMTMTLERLLSIFLPLRHDQILTKTKIMIYLSSQYGFAEMISVISLFYQNNDFQFCSYLDINSSKAFLIHGIPTVATLLFTCIGNITIFCAARSHIRAIASSQRKDNTDLESRMNFKATVTTILIVLPFLISYLPLGIFGIYMYLHQVGKTVMMYHFANGLFSLTIINGIINPLVYSWRLPELRLSLKRLLQRQ